MEPKKLWKIRLIFGLIILIFTIASWPILESYAQMVDLPVELFLAVVIIPSIIVLSSLLN
jgi:hypothetical protein